MPGKFSRESLFIVGVVIAFAIFLPHCCAWPQPKTSDSRRDERDFRISDRQRGIRATAGSHELTNAKYLASD
jgi:hypothetical protein